MKNIGLYVHIPFRIYKHNHRGVLSFFNKDFYIRPYFRYLKRELLLRKDPKYTIDSIYIGGGDPSCVDPDLIADLLDFIYKHFDVKESCEKTIELDPQTPPLSIDTYVKKGINRFSIKVFTFNSEGLDNLDLSHRKDDVVQLIKTIRSYRVDNINFDMYFSYPGQDLESLKRDLHIVNKHGIPHLSFYSSKGEEDLLLNKDMMEDHLPESLIIDTISNNLKADAYKRYEINHYCKEGYESIHAQKYWNLDPYMGVGIGASGLLEGILYKNSQDFEEYFEGIDSKELNYFEKEKLSNKDLEVHYILNKLSTIQGIDLQYFKERFGQDLKEEFGPAIEKYLESNIIEVEDGHLRFTPQGMNLANQLYMDIL